MTVALGEPRGVEVLGRASRIVLGAVIAAALAVAPGPTERLVVLSALAAIVVTGRSLLTAAAMRPDVLLREEEARPCAARSGRTARRKTRSSMPSGRARM